MNKNRINWNDRHKQLRNALEKTIDREKAIELFLKQHAEVHSSQLLKSYEFSFYDEIVNDLPNDAFRFIPAKCNHSIAWITWHLARVEDVTMNILVADKEQVLHKEDWNKKLKIKEIHTGNGMSNKQVRDFNNDIDITALKNYRLAVGKTTRQIVKKLKANSFKNGVNPLLIERTWNEKAMHPKGKRIVNYWSSRTISGLLLMPPTRHCFLHLNEARRIKEKIK